MSAPDKDLANRLELRKFLEHKHYRLLNALVRVLLDAVAAGFHIADRNRQKQFAAARLLLHRFDGTLPKSGKLHLAHRALHAEQESLILLRIPPEFRTESDPDSVVGRMLRVHGWDFFKSRLTPTNKIIEWYYSRRNIGSIRGPFSYAATQVRRASEVTEPIGKSVLRGFIFLISFYASLIVRFPVS